MKHSCFCLAWRGAGRGLRTLVALAVVTLKVAAQTEPSIPATPPATNTAPPAKPITLTRPHLAAPPAPAAYQGRPVLPEQFILLDGERHLFAAFARLASFPFEIGEAMQAVDGQEARARQAVLEALPDDVKALDNQAVAIVGFMQPGTMQEGLARDFALISHPGGCVSHGTPQLNHKVLVRMSGAGVKPVTDAPIAVTGRLRVGAMHAGKELMFIYQMDGEQVVPAHLIQFP